MWGFALLNRQTRLSHHQIVFGICFWFFICQTQKISTNTERAMLSPFAEVWTGEYIQLLESVCPSVRSSPKKGGIIYSRPDHHQHFSLLRISSSSTYDAVIRMNNIINNVRYSHQCMMHPRTMLLVICMG